MMTSTSWSQRGLTYSLIVGTVMMTGGAMLRSGPAGAEVVFGVQGGSQATQKREALFEIDDSSSFYGLSLGYRMESRWRLDLAYKRVVDLEVKSRTPFPDTVVNLQTLDVAVGREFDFAERYTIAVQGGRRQVVSYSIGATTHLKDDAYFYAVRVGRAISARSVAGIALLQSQYQHREIGLFWELALSAP